MKLSDIWPGLGLGYQKFPKNKSATKKGPGRTHKDGYTKALKKVHSLSDLQPT